MDTEHRNLNQDQKERFSKLLQDNEDLMKKFLRDYKRYPEAWDVMSSQKKLQEFAATLKIEDLEGCLGKENVSEEVAKAFSSGTDQDKLFALDSFSMGNIVSLYKYKNPKGYRTRTQAGNIVKKLPTHIATPTLTNYENTVSLYQKGNAYLEKLISVDNLQFQRGKLYFKGTLQQVSEAELQDIKTREGIENINLRFLRSYYSVILQEYEKCLQDKKKIQKTYKFYLPDLAEHIGLHRNINSVSRDSILEELRSFHNIIGVIHISRNGRPDKSYYPVLNFEGYDAAENTIYLSSPYLMYIVDIIYKASVITDRRNRSIKTNGSNVVTRARDTYMIRSEILKERNTAAVDNVFIIVAGLERSGGKQYHIAISTLIERNQPLKKRLETVKNPRQLLKSCFTKTWELLDTMTELKKYYKNIELPDPKDPAVIPTVRTIDSLVVEINHDGKIKM